MVDNNEDSLRNEIQRLKRAVTRKISRIKVGQDIHLSGTRLDPRRATESVRNLATPQLREYAREMASFLDRGNQYVPDSQMRPMPRAEWRTYKRLEAEWNQRVRTHQQEINSITLPSGVTIEQRDAMLRPRHPHLANPAVNGPREIERESTAVSGKASLRQLTDKMRERLDPDYFDKLNESGVETFEKMAEVVGDDSLAQQVRGLSAQQFEVLWNWTPFATAMSLQYELAMKELSPRDKETWAGTVLDNAVREAKEYVEWARRLRFSN
jgi:hypothetical protein